MKNNIKIDIKEKVCKRFGTVCVDLNLGQNTFNYTYMSLELTKMDAHHFCNIVNPLFH
jgi:hypothetical protein